MNSTNAEIAKQGLLRDIEQAFLDVRREDGVTLHEAVVIDAAGSDTERKKARKKDADQKWQEVTDGLIENHYSILSFLDSKGFRYYLPAYMVWSLKYYKASNSATTDFTIYALIPNGKGRFSKAQRERFGAFNAEQCRVISRFLQFMAIYSEGRADGAAVQNALDSYWGKYCANIS